MAMPNTPLETDDAASAARKKPHYGWLLFDADGTLFDYERAEQAALRQAFEQVGATFHLAYLATYRRINQALWQALERGETTPGALKVRRFELLLGQVGVTCAPTDFSQLYLERLALCSELIDGAAEVLRHLGRECRVAVLTNGLQTVQRSRLARSPIRDCVAELIISDEIGAAKPSREFFDVAFTRLGHPPRGEALMIGDNWSSDIVGAAQYGIDTCWYNPSRQPRPANPAVTFEITSLRELVPLVL